MDLVGEVQRAYCKQVISGDTLVLKNPADSSDLVIALADIVAPRLARRSQPNEEPFAWEAREFLRKNLVGRELIYFIENTQMPTVRKFATVFLPSNNAMKSKPPNFLIDVFNNTDFININESLVQQGLVDVRALNRQSSNTSELYRNLLKHNEVAKENKIGKYSTDTSSHVRNIEWVISKPQEFLESRRGQPMNGVIEYVKDACTFRATIFPIDPINEPFRVVTIKLSALVTPTFKSANENTLNMEEGGMTDAFLCDSTASEIAEPFAVESKNFLESRILQRELSIWFESLSGQQTFFCSLVHPRGGNIGLLLLNRGFARIVEWSLTGVTIPGAIEEMRDSEQMARNQGLGIWSTNSQPITQKLLNATDSNGSEVSFSRQPIHGRVVEVGLGDSLLVKTPDGMVKKFFLSSIRPPRPEVGSELAPGPQQNRSKILYSVPYLFEAREFLRRKIIGKKVTIHIDYAQNMPSGAQNQEIRFFSTVLVGGEINVAEALVVRGLAKVVRYRAGDEKRSRAYNQLLAAEQVAEKKAVGLFNLKDSPPSHKVSDLSGDSTKAKQFLTHLKRNLRMEALVEYVVTGNRLRVYIPKSTCLITLLLGGIQVPRSGRTLANGKVEKSEPFSAESLDFTKDLVMQREVEIEVENIDRGGNFIGWVFYNSASDSRTPNTTSWTNLSISLVEAGLASVHFTAKFSPYFDALNNAQTQALTARLALWSLDESENPLFKSTFSQQEESDIKTNQPRSKLPAITRGIVSCVRHQSVRFYVQFLASMNSVEALAGDINNYIQRNPPVPGAYTPNVGDLCLSQYNEDFNWYRARVLSIDRGGRHAKVLFIDSGMDLLVSPIATSLASLPHALASINPQAIEFNLGGLSLTEDADDHSSLLDFFESKTLNKEVELTPLYEDCVKLNYLSESNEVKDLAEEMLRWGLVYLNDQICKKRLIPEELVDVYQKAQLEAKKKHRNIWRYGDFTSSDDI